MKFYWYSDQFIKKYIQNKRQMPDITEHEFGDHRYKKLHLINKAFSSAPWGVLQDISNHVPHPFNVVTKTPYVYQPCNKTFGEVCLEVAKKIANSTDRKIAVNWSGGLDSTSVLVAMLQTIPHERLIVVCDQASINEYPGFYNDVIKDRIKTLDIFEWCDRATEFFTVSGDAGDTTWGVLDDSFWEKHHAKFNMPWKEWVAKKDWLDKEFVEEFCTWSGVNITTVLELRTWFYLCCKWQDKAMKFYVERPGLTDKDAVPFFDYDGSFHSWTINNLDKIIGPSWTTYKMPAKDFIYQYHPDQDYYKNKTKDYSFSMTDRSILWKIKTGTSKFAVDVNYGNHVLPSWPFVDQVQVENWNDQYQLIPAGVIER